MLVSPEPSDLDSYDSDSTVQTDNNLFEGKTLPEHMKVDANLKWDISTESL